MCVNPQCGFDIRMPHLSLKLQVEKNPAIGLRVLEATGVAPHRGELLQLPNGFERCEARLNE